ncbi:MAG: PKD domain-containing protein [Thermoplasmata archaeon]|nr:PKD domain-containing protein [Thermoplasmata archaeon]MBE3137141.1 PKD domain-containing protein [Thermoplasmata archaeon]MCJ7698219.1 PKD domain-containing protein [Thermoplasmata archaeon]
MNVRIKKKILALEMVLILIISGSVGYIIVSRQGLSNGKNENKQNDNIIQDTIKTTDETPQSIQAHIKAGPLTGYGPLAVSFYGNPEDDSDIVSYHWEFSPTTMPIIPQTQYKKVHFSFIFFFLFCFAFFPFSFAYLLLYTIISNHRYKASSQYESTERNPTMIFLYTGSYSATLTITDTQGNTSSDIVWITVLQYVHPDHD